MRTQQFEYLRPEEIIAERERLPLAYLPIGSLEWHGLHLPYGTDALNAQAVARLAAQRTGGVVLPTLFCGTERERPPEKLKSLGLDESAYVVGMDFPANPCPTTPCPAAPTHACVLPQIGAGKPWSRPPRKWRNRSGRLFRQRR